MLWAGSGAWHSLGRGRMKRLWVLLPTGAAVLSRMAQLGVLVLLATMAQAAARDVLIVGFGLLGAFAILTDSGAANYLLATPSGQLVRATYIKVVLFHSSLALLGAVAALVFVLSSAGWAVPMHSMLLLGAIALSQVLEGAIRSVKAPLLIARRDHHFAVVDLSLFVAKVPFLILAFVSRDLLWLLALPVVSALVLLVTYANVVGTIAQGRPSRTVTTYRDVLEYGVTGALSAFYSQSPLVLGSLILPVSQMTALALIYRIVQPLEIVPGTLSQQLLPRIRTRRTGPWAYWVAFAGGGLGICLALILGKPIIEFFVGGEIRPEIVFWVLAASVPFKWGNYALVAFVMGVGLIRARLLLTMAVGFIAALGTLFFAYTLGATGAAYITPISEILLTLGFVIVFARARKHWN